MNKVDEFSLRYFEFGGKKIVDCRKKIERLLEGGASLSSEEMICVGSELDFYVLELDKGQ